MISASFQKDISMFVAVFPRKIQIVTFALCSSVFAACGNESGDDSNNGGIIYAGAQGAAEYYNFLNECDKSARNSRKISYNIKGEIVREKTCSYDAATRLHKITEKRLSDGVLSVDTYSEIQFNEADNIVESKEWKDVEKKTLRTEHSFTYGADGKLVQGIEKSDDGKTVATTTYDGEEQPSKKTTVAENYTRTTTCFFMLFDRYPCEETLDGEVQESITVDGEEFVRKQLVKGQLTEVERFSVFTDDPELYKNRSYKNYDFNGDLKSQTSENCEVSGDTAVCKETQKTAAGTEFYSLTTNHRNVGKVSITIGSLERIYDVWFEESASFAAKDDEKEYSGTLTVTLDVATFNRDADINFEMKKVPNPDLQSVYVFAPYWTQMTSSLEDLFAESLTSGSVKFRTTSRFNDNKDEILSEITGFTGLTTDQVNQDFVFKEEYIYQ
jgi:hypothetical protein